MGPSGPAFVTEFELSALDDPGAGDVALGLVLPCWTLLGMLDRALELTIAHVSLRKQFGQALSSFQGVQFQLTDAEVERSGVDILAKHALWSIATDRPEALEDALALRMAAIEAAEVVFRVCHQLHGAVGFCDETTLSWLSRYSQPLRRLPFGLSATRDHLTRAAGRAWPLGTVLMTPTWRPSGPRCGPGAASTSRPTGARPRTASSDDEFVRFQKCWFAELRTAGYAVPHWPARMGRRHDGDRTGRALPGTGRARRAAAGAGVRRHPPRRIDSAGRGHR